MPSSSYDRRWIARWIAGSVLAHLLGGLAAVGIMVGAHVSGLAGANVFAAIVVGAVAGLAGGFLTGVAGSALLPAGVSRATWVRGTMAGAVILWMLVAITPALLIAEPSAPEKPLLARFALAMCIGSSAGMLLSAFQVPALAMLAVRVRPWLIGNGAAWGAATPVTYAVTGVPSSSSATALAALLLLAVAGVTAGATTTITLLLEERRAQLIGQSTGRTCATELV